MIKLKAIFIMLQFKHFFIGLLLFDKKMGYKEQTNDCTDMVKICFK